MKFYITIIVHFVRFNVMNMSDSDWFDLHQYNHETYINEYTDNENDEHFSGELKLFTFADPMGESE